MGAEQQLAAEDLRGGDGAQLRARRRLDDLLLRINALDGVRERRSGDSRADFAGGAQTSAEVLCIDQRARAVVDGDQFGARQGGETGGDGVLALRTAGDERADFAAAVCVGDPCGGGTVGWVGHDHDVGNLGAGRHGGEGVGEDGASGERGEQFVAAAHTRAAAGGQQHAGGAHGFCSPLRAAKIMRPAWV